MSDAEHHELTAEDLVERDPLVEIDEALTSGGYHPERFDNPDAALRWFLHRTWSDLQDARTAARDGRWSIACLDLVQRIVGLTRLLDPVPWDRVPIDLVHDGW